MIDQKLRVAESQKVFHSGSNLLPEKGPNYYPEHLKPKEKMLIDKLSNRQNSILFGKLFAKWAKLGKLDSGSGIRQ